ncbi:MAG: CU044_2847 family protein [Sandaracinaceae bacterium]
MTETSWAEKKLRADPRLAEEADGNALLDELEGRLPRVTLDGETYWVAEGDLLLDAHELRLYALDREDRGRFVEFGERPREGARELVGIRDDDGALVRWPKPAVLRYCIRKEEFPGAQQHRLVREMMRIATDDWMAACGVSFVHEEALDEPGTDRTGLTFTVRYAKTKGLIAAGFFPHQPKHRHHVIIDPTFFTQSSYELDGVLRHELGHVLGFRHEHIRAEAPPECPKAETSPGGALFPFGEFDPHSVMHYFCGGVGTSDMRLTEVDVAGARQLYGPPKTVAPAPLDTTASALPPASPPSGITLTLPGGDEVRLEGEADDLAPAGLGAGAADRAVGAVKKSASEVAQTIQALTSELVRPIVEAQASPLRPSKLALELGLDVGASGNVWVVKGSAKATIKVIAEWQPDKKG